MNVCVIGLGYIGLPTAAMLASNGHKVHGVDTNEKMIEAIRTTGALSEEPGLADLVQRVLNDGALTISQEPAHADCFIICLPTPVLDDKSPDLSFVKSGVESMLPFLKNCDMLVLESTVPPGTTAGLVADMVRGKGFDPLGDVDLVFAPERVIPGNILKELETLDRVMGGLTAKAAERAKNLYSTFVKGEILLTDATTAEFVKLVENSYRDVNIAFANELAVLSEQFGINVWEAVKIANRHPRVNIHNPGPGVGGHCIAVDPYFIIDTAGDKARLLSMAREVNSSMPEHVVMLAEQMLGGLEGKNIAVLGIAYKGNVGDPRESPALDIITALENRSARWKAYDPHVKESPITLSSFEDALEDADLVIVATDHNVFRDMEPEAVGNLVKKKQILDTRNLLDRKKWAAAGWKVKLIGSS